VIGSQLLKSNFGFLYMLVFYEVVKLWWRLDEWLEPTVGGILGHSNQLSLESVKTKENGSLGPIHQKEFCQSWHSWAVNADEHYCFAFSWLLFSRRSLVSTPTSPKL
jgi:hypothetical protein